LAAFALSGAAGLHRSTYRGSELARGGSDFFGQDDIFKPARPRRQLRAVSRFEPNAKGAACSVIRDENPVFTRLCRLI